MTYSLTEKEEILYERQIDELFDLTEASPLTSPEKSKVDRSGNLIDPATAWRLRKADATDHYTDMYKWPDQATPTQSIVPRVDSKDDESDPFDVPEVPLLLPTIPKKVKKPVPKPRPKQKLISLTKPKTVPKPEPKRYVPKLPNRPIVTPIKPVPKKPIVRKPPQLRPPPVRTPLTAPIRKPPQLRLPKPKLPPLSPRNQIASKMAQGEIDKIIKKLQNKKTTLPQGKKLLMQLGKLDQLKKPLQLTIPKTQIPKRFGLPDAIKPKLDAPNLKLPKLELPKISKLDVPKPQLLKPSNLVPPKLGVPTPGSLIPKVMSDADLAKLLPKGKAPTITIPKALATEIEVTRKKLATAQKNGNKVLVNRLTNHLKKQLGTYVEPDIAQKRVQAKAASSAIQKADAKALAQRKAKQAAEEAAAKAAEKARLAQVAKDAEQAALAKAKAKQVAKQAAKKVPPVDTSTAHLVGADGKPIDNIKKKAEPVKEPLPKSRLGQGMVQPRPGEGIKAFAKRLKFDSVADFEKANPKGVGVDKKTGNKFVKTGVSYINKVEVDRLNSIAIGKAGKANELDNAKRLLDKERNKPPTKQNKVRIDKLKSQVDNLEAEVKGRTKVKPGEVIKGGDKTIKLKDLRSRTNPHRLADESKMLFKRGVKSGRKLAGKMAAKAGGYLVPGLNVAIIAYDIHELMLGTANAGEDAWLRQDDIMELNAVLASNATAEEKKEMINSRSGWQWDSDNDENDPPYPVLDENEKEIDAHKMSSADLESKLPGMLAGTPHAQKDIDVIIQRVLKMKEHDLQISPHQVKDKKAYLNEYKAKLSILKKIKSTLPETRLDSIKNYLTVVVDKNEEQWEQVRLDLAAGKITLDDAKEFFDKDGNDVRPSISQAIANARVKDKEKREREERLAKEKEEAEPGLWQQGYDFIADLFTGDDEEATASMGVAPSKNNDPEVVATVGSPYGSPGAPKDFDEYENLMRTVAGEFDLPLPVVRALAMQESGMHATGGTLSPWSYTGDHDLGKKGAFGPFHVRSDPDKGAALEHYNEVKGTNHTWKDIATDGMLAAKVGATYFKHWYDDQDGDAQKAYELYNGGPSGYMKTQSIANAKIFAKKLKRFTESKMYIQKSAILEGIAKAA